MIVVNAKESKKSSDLSQGFLGAKPENGRRFSDILSLVERLKASTKEDTAKEKNVLSVDQLQAIKGLLQPSVAVVTKTSQQEIGKGATDKPMQSSIVAKPTQSESAPTRPSKEQMLSVLLGASPELVEEGESMESLSALLQPKVVEQLSDQEFKSTLIHAKQQLRAQIETVLKAQQIEIKTMPQSLKGLYDLALKLQINVETITLETLQVKTESVVSTVMRLPILIQQGQTVAPQASALRSALSRSAEKSENENRPNDQPLKALLLSTSEPQKTQQISSVSATEATTQRQTPLENAPASPKSAVRGTILPSAPAPQVLGDAPSSTTNAAQASALEATAKGMLVPTEEKLAALLFGEVQEVSEPAASTTPEAKSVTSAAVQSADALEVKIKEAQQTVRHFATELKEAVENYKPPFTRLKITLNPAKLGEVDVTMIQRGNSVHINVSSNSAALNLLAHNASELKTQLTNNGVVNTTMQFSTAHSEQQQQGQQRSHTFAYNYKTLEALSEEELELITSIEITLPKYA